jgi:hypothetical protein
MQAQKQHRDVPGFHPVALPSLNDVLAEMMPPWL